MTECVNAAHRGASLSWSTQKKTWLRTFLLLYAHRIFITTVGTKTGFGDQVCGHKKGIWLVAYDVITLERTRSWEWEPTEDEEWLRTKNGQDCGVHSCVRKMGVKTYKLGLMCLLVSGYTVMWKQTVIVLRVFAWILSHYCSYEKYEYFKISCIFRIKNFFLFNQRKRTLRHHICCDCNFW